jgi:hypothetical protein
MHSIASTTTPNNKPGRQPLPITTPWHCNFSVHEDDRFIDAHAKACVDELPLGFFIVKMVAH